MGCLSCAALARTSTEVTLRRRESSSIPIEAETISPDRFRGLSETQIARLPAYYGRRLVTLGDLFEIEGVHTDQIGVEGDVSHVKKIGYGMTRGSLTIRGDAGPHTGALMSGGELTIDGDAGDWLGAQMKGGVINVMGGAGNFVGGAYPGEARGMNRGLIVVRGNVGQEAGLRMRRGLIVVLGATGDFPGAHMIAGTLLALGRLAAPGGRDEARDHRRLGRSTGVASRLPLLGHLRTGVPAFLHSTPDQRGADAEPAAACRTLSPLRG